MKRILAALLCAASLLRAETARIDASSPEALERSYAAVIESLDDRAQQKFSVAMTIIGVVMAQRPDLGGSAKIKELINGKTAEEIIAESKKLTGSVRMNSGRIDGSSSARFSETLGTVLISLPEGRREKFSEAAAKLIYERQNKKIPESEFLKSVDGKTADEIIEMAREISVPFVVSPEQAKNADLEKLSPEQVKKRYGIDVEKGKKSGGNYSAPAIKFTESLVPPK